VALLTDYSWSRRVLVLGMFTRAAIRLRTWSTVALTVAAPCRMFETFSFLPPLGAGEIARQVDYIIANGWTPCLEFAESDCAYVQDKAQTRFGNSASCVRFSGISATTVFSLFDAITRA
jgi:Ribulose bisphosphate carboxylase, small chain